MFNGLTELEQDVDSIVQQQGWTDETVGEIAYGFIINSAPKEVQEAFFSYIQDIQNTENEGMEDSYDESEEEGYDKDEEAPEGDNNVL